MAASPPAIASSNVRRGRPTVGRGSLEGDRAAVPAEGRPTAVIQGSSPAHTATAPAAGAAARPCSLQGGCGLSPARPSEQSSWTPREGQVSFELLRTRPRRYSAPTFQLGQHLELGRELVVEIVLDAVQLQLVVLHGCWPYRRTRLRTSRAPRAAPAPSEPAPPINGRRARRRSPLARRKGGEWAGLRAHAGRGRALTPDGEPRDPGALHWSIGPPVRTVGGTWAGLRPQAEPGQAHLCGLNYCSGTAGPRGAGRECGNQGQAAASEARTAQPSCRSIPEWAGAREGFAAGVHRAPLRRCP